MPAFPTTSRRELARLIILVMVAVFCIGIVVIGLGNLHKPVRPSPASPQVSFPSRQEIEATPKPVPLPFQDNPALMKTVTDDEYVQTEPFYYLVHKMTVASQEKLVQDADASLGWQQLRDLSQRENIRGKTMRVRGGLVHLERTTLSGKEAQARGLDNASIWKGAIYTARGHFYLFWVTEMPPDIYRDADVELVGTFFKIWVYTSKSGDASRAPVILGKTLTILPRVIPKGPQQLALGILIVFACLGILLIILVVRDYQKNQGALAARIQKRFLRLRKKAIPKDPSSV